MNKIKVTRLQRDNALYALNDFWPSVHPDKVDANLEHWRQEPDEAGLLTSWIDDMGRPPQCGTMACFGGWVEWCQHFRAQLGLAPDKGEMDFDDLLDLFGVDLMTGMTAARGGCKADAGFEGSDHELVSNRLNWLIENSEVVA
jgi:hypothetical protein